MRSIVPPVGLAQGLGLSVLELIKPEPEENHKDRYLGEKEKREEGEPLEPKDQRGKSSQRYSLPS